MSKVSVIIPVYGVEKYIERCARSLFEQTLDDIEYIFVDDCTPDNSMQILNKVLQDYPHRMNNVRICRHEKNLGLPFARKTGIKLASGSYIIHCDSDDWVEKNLYELMYEKAMETSADIVYCNVAINDGTRVIKKMSAESYSHKDDYILDMLYLKQPWSLWNKLVKHCIYLNDIEYPVNYMGEDMALSFQLLIYSTSVVNLNCDSSYFYYVNLNSESRQNSIDGIRKKYFMYEKNAEIIKSILEKLHNKEFDKAMKYVEFHHKQSLWPFIQYNDIKEICKKDFPAIEMSVVMNSYVNMKYRLKAIKQILVGLFIFMK